MSMRIPGKNINVANNPMATRSAKPTEKMFIWGATRISNANIIMVRNIQIPTGETINRPSFPTVSASHANRSNH